MRKTNPPRSPEELAEFKRQIEANGEKSEAEAAAEEQRQADARRDFIETAARQRRCKRRPNPGW